MYIKGHNINYKTNNSHPLTNEPYVYLGIYQIPSLKWAVEEFVITIFFSKQSTTLVTSMASLQQKTKILNTITLPSPRYHKLDKFLLKSTKTKCNIPFDSSNIFTQLPWKLWKIHRRQTLYKEAKSRALKYFIWPWKFDMSVSMTTLGLLQCYLRLLPLECYLMLETFTCNSDTWHFHLWLGCFTWDIHL